MNNDVTLRRQRRDYFNQLAREAITRLLLERRRRAARRAVPLHDTPLARGLARESAAIKSRTAYRHGRWIQTRQE